VLSPIFIINSARWHLKFGLFNLPEYYTVIHIVDLSYI